MVLAVAVDLTLAWNIYNTQRGALKKKKKKKKKRAPARPKCCLFRHFMTSQEKGGGVLRISTIFGSNGFTPVEPWPGVTFDENWFFSWVEKLE